MKFILPVLSLLFMSLPALSQTPMTSLFQNQLDLRRSVNPANADTVKDQLREIREQIDILAEKEWAQNQTRPLGEKSPVAFSEHVLLSPQFSTHDFKSGDVILLRGSSVVSSTIATLTDSVTQFSHSLIIYEDPKTKKTFAIEALIDPGVIVRPLDEALSEGVSRMLLLRHKNSETAAQAAELAYTIAMNKINQGTHYPYDFSGNGNDHSQVTCFEWIQYMFELASNGKVQLPTYISTVGKKFPNTVKSLGLPLSTREIFAPSDLDVEPQLDVVAEWRDPAATLNFRVRDALFLKTWEMVEAGSLVIDYGAIMKSVKSGKSSGGEGGFNPATIKTVTEKVQTVVDVLAVQLLELNRTYAEKTGLNMNTATLTQAASEALRAKTSEALLLANGFKKKWAPVSCNNVLAP